MKAYTAPTRNRKLRIVHLVPYRIGRDWFVFDRDRNEVVSEAFQSVHFVDSTIRYSTSLLVCDKGGLFFLVNQGSARFDQARYESLSRIDGVADLFIVGDGVCYGIINCEGEFVCKLSYSSIKSTSLWETLPSFLIVERHGAFGIFNLQSGEFVVDLEYENVRVSGNYFILRKGGVHKLYQPNSEIFEIAGFEEVEGACSDDVSVVSVASKWGLYDVRKKRLLNNTLYDYVSEFWGYAYVALGRDCYLIYYDGQLKNIGLNCTYCDSKLSYYRDGQFFVVDEIGGEKRWVHTYIQGSHIATFDVPDQFQLRLNGGVVELLKFSHKYWVSFVTESYLLTGERQFFRYRGGGCEFSEQCGIWSVNDVGLYRKGEMFFELEGFEFTSLDLSVEFPFVNLLIDVDPEFGVTEDAIGYIDHEGRHYWADHSAKLD